MSEELIKKAIGVNIQPLYKVPGTQESKEFECEFTDRTPIGDDEPIAPEYDNLYRGPLRRLKYSSALDYSSLSPFVQHQYGVGYDGNNSMNRSEFPRNWPWQRHNYYTKITDGDYEPTEYTEGNPDLLPKRDELVKYRDTDYLNEDEKTQHFRDHQMNQNTLELLGSSTTMKLDEAFPLNDFVILPNGKPAKVIGYDNYNKGRVVEDDNHHVYHIPVEKLKTKCGMEESLVKLAVFNNYFNPLINLLENMNDTMQPYKTNEIFEYAIGGLAYIKANYKKFDSSEQKLYDTLIYNSMHEMNILKNQIHIYTEQPSFNNNPIKYLYKTLKDKYHNLYELVRIGKI